MTTQSKDVEAAILRLDSGADLTFDAVYEAEFGYVWHTLRKLGANSTYLEDLTQDVFVVVCRRLVDFDSSRPIRPWLFGISYRVVRDFQRRAFHNREVKRAELSEVSSADRSPEEDAAARQDRQMIASALEKLDVDKRAVLIMHDIDGHSMPDIAESLSLPLNTAYSRLRLARKAVAKTIQSFKHGEVSHDSSAP